MRNKQVTPASSTPKLAVEHYSFWMSENSCAEQPISKILAIKNEGNKAYTEGMGLAKWSPLDGSCNCRTFLEDDFR